MSNEELIKSIRQGNSDSYDQLFIKNKRLIKDCIRNYYCLEDAENIANIAFVKAVNEYDESKGLFSTCLWNYIMQELKRESKKAFTKKRTAEIMPLEDVLVGKVDKDMELLSYDLSKLMSQIHNEIEKDIIKYHIVLGKPLIYLANKYGKSPQSLNWYVKKVKKLLKDNFAVA